MAEILYGNVLLDKSLAFAVRCVKLNRFLRDEKREFVLSKQMLRSGTSIGANISESQGAQSDSDFIAKLHISLKEARETEYWFKLLFLSDLINEPQYQSMHNDLSELEALLTSIIKKKKSNQNLGKARKS